MIFHVTFFLNQLEKNKINKIVCFTKEEIVRSITPRSSPLVYYFIYIIIFFLKSKHLLGP